MTMRARFMQFALASKAACAFRTLIALLGLVACGLVIDDSNVWAQFSHPTYIHRYRLTVHIEIDGKVHTGSSVIEVRWVGQSYVPGVGSFLPRIKGQAAFVDLGSRGAVVAALITGQTSQEKPDGSRSAIWLASLAFGNPSTNERLAELPHLRGQRSLAPDNMPRFIWFANPADPTSARKFTPDEIGALFGPTARLTASVEITSEPILIDISKKLPWYQEWANAYRARGPMYLPNGTVLSRYMFVGDAS